MQKWTKVIRPEYGVPVYHGASRLSNSSEFNSVLHADCYDWRGSLGRTFLPYDVPSQETSYGSIRVLLVEADEGSKKSRSDNVDAKFFVTVSLVDKESSTLAHSLLISLTIIGDRSASNCQRTTIPVSRLEEDTEMYTSSSPITNKGEIETPLPGSAIKLQIVYMKVELPNLADTELLDIIKEDLIPESADTDTAEPAVLPTDSIPVVPESIPVVPESIPVVPESIPVVPESIPVRPKVNMMVPLPRKRSISSIPKFQESIPKSQDSVPLTWKSAPLIPDPIPKVPEPVPKILEPVPKISEPVPKISEPVPNVPVFIPLTPEPITTRPQSNTMVPLPRKRSIKINTDPVPLEDEKKDIVSPMPEKILVGILKSPTSKTSQVSMGSSRKEDIRTTFSKDVEVNCFEEHVSDVDSAEKRSNLKKQEPSRNFSFNLDEEALVDEKEGEERLTVGLIDYALLIGPLDDGFGGTGTGTGTAQGSIPQSGKSSRKIHVQYSLRPDSADIPFSGYGSSMGQDELEMSMSPTSRNSVSRNSSPMESDMCIWDRFPLDDHEESPLADKIEYFACPDGSKEVRSATRPEPRFSTFILSGSGESDGQFGICMTVFIKSHNNLYLDLQSISPLSRGQSNSKGDRTSPLPEDLDHPNPPTEPAVRVSTNWWQNSEVDGGGVSDHPMEGDSSLAWTAVTVCFLSRWPHVQQLQRCLLYLYRSCILTSLERWEERCEVLIAAYKDKDQATPRSCPDGGYEDDRGEGGYLVLEPVRLPLKCVELLTMLCLESPVPLWGVFTLDIVLPGTLATSRTLSFQTVKDKEKDSTQTPPPSEKEKEKEKVAMVPIPVKKKLVDTVIEFAHIPPDDLPLCPYSICNSIFHCLGARGVLTVLSAALAESRILFFSSDAFLLPAVCESLRVLLYPLKWAHVYLPVVPAPLLDLVQAPVPFILGTLTKWIDLIPSEYLSEVILVDLDTGAIDSMRNRLMVKDTPSADMVLPFPPKIERWLLCSLNEVLMPNQDVSDVTSQDSQMGRVQAKDTMVQLLVFDVMANLLRYVPGCIFSLNIGDHEGPSHHVFNRPLFLLDCIEEETRPFLTLLTDTNAFEQFTESLYSPSMGFYLRSLNALPTPISSLKPGSFPLRPSGAPRRSSRQIDRDVLLLSGDEVVPVVKDDSGTAFSFPDSIINGGDRLNVVKVPVPVLSSAQSSPEGSRRGSNNSSSSSSSIRGMLVFPAVSQQVNQPFSAQNACSCDSVLSRSTDSSLPKHKAHSEESDIGRLLIMFPDWIASLLALKGLEAAALQGRVPFSRPVIDFYSGFLMCYREQQVLEDTYDCEPSGKDYEGYQLGNTISRKAGPAGAEPFPVLTLVLSSCKVRNIVSSFSSDQESSSQVTFSDIEGLDDSFDSYQGHRPRPKSLRSPSQMERERMAEDAKSPVKRSMVPLPARSGSGEARPQSLNLSKAKRLRAQSMRLPGSTPSGITNTGDSSNGLSPSYLSFLPLIGKPAGLNMTDSGRIAETESITSSPAISPHTSLSGALNYGMTPATMSLALQKEDGVIVRSRSYGRIRSSTFSLVSSKKGSASATKQIRRRHSAESAIISPSMSAPPSTPSPVSAPPVSRMPPSMYKMERRNRVQPLSSGSMDSSESRKLTSSVSASSMVSIPSTDSLDPLRDPLRDSLRSSNQYQLEIDTTEKGQSALCLCPPLIFDTAAFENAAGEIDEWTVSELAQALKQPLKSILKTMKGEADLGIDPFSPWPSSNNSPAPAGAAEASKPSNVRSPSRKWPNRVAMGMGGAPVTDYLQFAFSGVSMSPRQIEHLERRCASALEAHDNRMRLVYLLRQTNKGTPAIPANSPAISRQRLELVQPNSQSKDLESQLFPLHSSTFELLSKLYSLAVESCVTHRDYLAAYGLLGVGGLYFQVESRPQRRQSANDISDGIHETEFLSERICQHPIFQSPHLWLAVMRDKLSFSKKGSTGDDDDDDDDDEDEIGGEEKSPVVYDIDALFLESYALLFIINRLGVNFERAAAFNKMVASDFSLAKGQYLQLQQYTEQLYGRRISSGQSPLLLKKGSGEFVVSRSRSKSDSSRVKSEWGKSKDRNSFPASTREGTIVFKNDNSTDWGSDAGADSQAPTYMEGLEVVLADLTLLLPTAPPTPHDDYSPSPVSWSQNAIPNFSPVGTTKAKSNPTPFLRSLGRPVPAVLDPMPCQPPRGYGYAPRMRSEAPSGRKQRRNTENLTPDVPSPARRRASAMATKLKSYFTRRGSKTDMAREEGAGEDKQLGAVKVTSTSEPSSPQPLPGAPSQQDSERELETETEREDSPMRCWTDRHKCLQGQELNNRNYYSVPLEGSLIDHPVSVCTTGRYLIAGLRDGGINVNNLTTGSLVLRLSHSSDKSTSAASKQSRTPLRPYGGVTHLQCLTPPEPCTAPGRGPSPALGDDSLCAFVSACSGGIVKVWRLGPSTANGQTSGGRWSGRRRGPIEEELTSEDDLVLSDQAVLEVHPGDTITCLQADCDSSHQRNKRTDNPGGWVVVSGDRKGLVIISWGDFSLPPSAHDSASEEEGSGKHPNYTLKKRDSHSAGQRLSSQQPRPQQMAVRSVPVTVLVGKGEISCLTLTRKQGRVFGRSQWDLMAVGTSTGRIALVDVLEGKCRYMLEGHSGCVTGVVSLSHLLADDMDQGGHSGSLIASCGSDRRVLLWDTFCSTPVPASDHATKRSVHNVEDEIARNGALPAPPVIEGRMLCVSGIAINNESKQRSAAGPLIALCISPTATSVSRQRQHLDSACVPRGLEHRSFVLAAACADGAILLWDLTLRLPGEDFDKSSEDDSEIEDKLSALGSPHKHLLVGHVCVLRGHSDRVTEIKYRSCGTIETASLDGTMRVWTQIRSPSLSPRLSGTNTPHGVLSPRDGKGPFSSFTCSAVLKLFGTDTDDCQGVAFFSVATCIASSRSIMGDSRAPNSNLSPPRILFSDSQSELEEGDRGSETPSSALEGKDDTEGAEETARRPAVPAVWPSAVPWGKSWLVAVSLGGNIKAFITPTLAPSMPRPSPF